MDVPVGTRLAGDIDLDTRFPSLASVLRETDVVIFWAFRLEASDRIGSVAAGAVVLPREVHAASGSRTGRTCTEHRISFTRKGGEHPD